MLKASAETLKQDLGEEHPLTQALQNSASYSQRHVDVVEKWGRFPHRNEILGRESTEAEAAGLADGSIEGF